MVASVTVAMSTFAITFLLTRNLWIGFGAALACSLIWNFMGAGK